MTPPSFSPDELAERRRVLVDALGTSAAVLCAPLHAIRNGDAEYRYRQGSDLHYFTGWADPEAVAVVRPGAEQPFVLFVQAKDRERETWTGRREGVEGARERYGADAAFPIGELAARLPLLLQGYDTVHYAFGEDAARDQQLFRALRAPVGPSLRNGLDVPHQIVHAGRLTGELRLKKRPAEIERLRRAAAITVEAHVRAMQTGRPGVPEYEVEAAIDHTFRQRGGNGPGYTTIVGGGANACILHYVTNSDPLRDGDLCLVDAGCEVGNYTADVTRTWPVGGRFSGPQRDLYEVVLAAHGAACAEARAGTPYRRMHDAAVRTLVEGMIALNLLDGDVDELIAEEAYRRYYMHSTGHWLGMDVHDPGAYHVGGRSRPLEPGHVVTVEPGLYVPPDDERAPDAFRGIGIRIEDDLLVTGGDPENLTLACPRTIADVEAACGR